jgi:hypothetical protein
MWTLEGYWNLVIGADRTADSTVREFDLTSESLDEWLGAAETEAWTMGGEDGGIPDEWEGFHAKTLAALRAAIEAA